jgi:lipoyl(octanoyl) transferase
MFERSGPTRQLLVVDLGRRPYAPALALQRAAARARIAGTLDQDLLLLLEHPPVVTLGRGTKPSSLPLAPDAIRARGVEVHEIDRGGDVTFHGPGQLVGYPIVDLTRHRKDLHWYLRQVEEALIVGVAALGVRGTRSTGYTGVWVEDGRAPGDASPARRKLASIGVHARDWVTWHGFALNVTHEPLRFFDLIVPCGIPGVDMTSVARELDRDVALAEVGPAVARGFARVFDLEAVAMEPDALEARLAAFLGAE